MTTDESSLTEMSEDEVETVKKPPPISAQKAYEYLVPLIQRFNATVEKIMLPKELREDWNNSTTSIASKAIQKSYKVAIAGKSTLLNALLHNQVLSASASGACTAVVTEISYKNVKNVEAVVEFIAEEDWTKALCRLIEDANDTAVETQEGPADNSKISLAQQARKKILGSKWNVHELVNDTLVHQYLGTTSVFSAKGSTNFQKELEQFLASAMSSGDTRALWPLVKIVKIMGPFDVLATGVTLVDLPGHGDIDNVRDTVAHEYMKSADAICLVSNIARAKDDRDMHENLHKLLSQVILDGRVKDKSILLVLTGADNTIGSNEITLRPDQQAIVDTLQQEAIELGQDITRLQATKDKKEKSRRKAKPELIADLKDQITEKRRQKECKVREKNRLLALGRSEIVTRSLQQTYMGLYRDMARTTEEVPVPSIPIFCIELVPDSSAIFLEKEETQIPRLRRYLEDDGERRSLADAIVPMTNLCTFLFVSRTTQFSVRPSADASKAQDIDQIINGVQQKCWMRLQRLLDDIEKEYASLLAIVKTAVGAAERKSPEIIQEKETFKWNRYKAMMRSEGQYDQGNLNSDLTKEILPAVQKQWFRVVNTNIPLLISEFCDDIKDLLNEAVPKQIKHLGTLRRSLGIDPFITHLKSTDIDVTASAQRQGSRGWEPLVRSMLRPHYAQVAAEKGPGMYKRMKLASSGRCISTNRGSCHDSGEPPIYPR
ncbi:Dynamin family-domain-containing protein [Mycena haematopus]|nr:Dynamin family-domain-containing protein [Mycena haematopus]